MEIAKKADPKTTEKPVFEKLDPIPAAPSSKYLDLCPLNLPHPLTQKGQKGRPRYQMALEDAQLKHGDETQPIENPEAHLKAYRESVKIMKSLGPTWPGIIPTGCRLGSALYFRP